ncbi:unnamed protein product [Meloidogyne enterolobii]|uniref:Uncharacterized protein n=1 Tax=Meloidogyne enterolobii TaxID=390850 RepID=A0ACB0YE74_MELEN
MLSILINFVKSFLHLEIISAKSMEDNDGKPRGFGFVAFMDHESAARSVEEMNEKEVPGRADLHFTVLPCTEEE